MPWLCWTLLHRKRAIRPIFCCESHTKQGKVECMWLRNLNHVTPGVMIYHIHGKYWTSFYHSKPKNIMHIVWTASATGSLMIIFQSWRCQIQTDNSHQIKELSLSLPRVPLASFVWKAQTIESTFLSFSLTREWMNTSEYMIELWCFWRTSQSHYSLSSWYCRNSFCYRIDNSWGFRYKILGHVGPLGENLNFFGLSWDCWNF